MGSYNDMLAPAEQMEFESTILSRFDMMFLVKDVRDEDRDFNLCQHVINLHRGVAEDVSDKAPIDINQLRKYISYARAKCSPRLAPEAAEVLQNQYVEIRKKMREDPNNGIPIT